jgi:hypothetical protein
MKCKKCNALLTGDICTDCGANNAIVVGFNDSNLYTDEPCGLCGQRGRRIDLDKKSMAICFDCHAREDAGRINHRAYKDWNEAEHHKNNILVEDILKPLFYGDNPSYDRYESLI